MSLRPNAILSTCLLLIAGACQRPHTAPAEGHLLPPEMMVEVLADAHVAEAALQHLHGPKRDSLAQQYYRQIFAIHGIREEDFTSTYEQLRRQPERLDAVYGEVMARLDRFRSGVYSSKPSTQPSTHD